MTRCLSANAVIPVSNFPRFPWVFGRILMGLDYVDIFYSHRVDPDTPLEETMGALTQIHRQGKALYVGISSYSPELTRGQSLAQMAIAWVLRDPRVTSALVGARTVDQLANTIASLENMAFTAEELSDIDRFATEGGINIWKVSSDL